MNDSLLVELFTEELPPKALNKLGVSFASTLFEELVAAGFVANTVEYRDFATPRRLAVLIPAVAANSAARSETKKLMPAKVDRTACKACCGWASDTFKSSSKTCSAGCPSKRYSTWPSASVTSRSAVMGRHPCVTRETKATCVPKATPLKPPSKTPRSLAADCVERLCANCTVSCRLEAKPPNR